MNINNWHMGDFSRVVVLDLETTINAPDPHFGAAPFHPDNRVVLAGYCVLFGEDESIVTTDSVADLCALLTDDALVVGHNIAFDLHYLYPYFDKLPSFTVFDTQVFEYLSTGKSKIMPSLENTAYRLEVPFTKDSEVSERFKVGIGSDKIDKELLGKYLVEDVRATKDIFLKQSKSCNGYHIMLMQGVLVTSKMSYVGMPFDVASAQLERTSLQYKINALSETLTKNLSKMWPPQAKAEFSLESPLQMATLLWGGLIKTLRQAPVLDEGGNHAVYKSGLKKDEYKFKTVEDLSVHPGLTLQKTRVHFEQFGWKMNADIVALERIKACDERAKGLCCDLLDLRQLMKSASTYFDPYIERAILGRVHPSYNHTIAQTGRLTSSKPNMQNISGKGGNA
jgi:DNA polymerase I-like protein with 3'-5' exonuclease and polymerase domains